MSEETSPVFFVRFSDNRRKYIEFQNKKSATIRKNNFAEYYAFNFIPIVLTSTLLCPLYRLKTLLQVKEFIPTKNNQDKNSIPKNLNLKYFITSKFIF